MDDINLPPQELTHPLVKDICVGIFKQLEKPSVKGIYLGGSLAIGGFDADTSDLDFLVIAETPFDAGTVKKLGKMHDKIRASNKNRLYGNYEGDYITIAQAHDPLSKDIVSPHLGTDGHFGVEGHGAAIIIDLWKIRKSGFTVFGKTPAAVIGNISTDDMLKAKRTLFKSWWLPKLELQAEMNSEYQAYAILTMARILFGIKQGGETSKREAAEWLKKDQPEFADLVQKALDWKENVRLNEQQQTYKLIAYVDSQVH